MSFSQPAPTFKVGLTVEEKQVYSQLFKSLDTENTGIVSGEKARTTFEKSGLPPTILGEIWQIADENNLGFLTQFGFCLAMRLIGQTQAGSHPSLAAAERPGPLPKFANLSFPGQQQQQHQQQQHQQQPQHQPLISQPSNNSSFMQTQPSSLIPQNTATLNSHPQDPISNISSADYQRFRQLFVKTVGSAQGDLGGNQAKDIFLKAKLPTNTLGQIWNLVDKDNLGKLDINSFIIAMHLIHGVLSGVIKQLPPFLPEHVWNSVESYSNSGKTSGHLPVPDPVQGQNPSIGSRQPSYASSVASQSTTVRHSQSPPASREPSVSNPWIISPTLKQQYEAIFDNLDKNRVGQLNADQVASVLMSSKLNQEDLATVWDLSDIQNTGIFTKLEFTIALFLVNRKLSGGALPNIVPDSLVESIKSGNVEQKFAQPQHSQQQQQQPRTAPPSVPPPKQPVQQSKTAMEDLVDIFGSTSSPSPAAVTTPTTSSFNINTATSPASFSAPQRAISQSELTPTSSSGDLPKVRKNLSGSFKPTSTFGQSLLHKQPLESPREEAEAESLLGDDHTTPASPPPVQPPAPVAAEPVQKQHTVNYDALRAVPPPPSQRSTSTLSPAKQPSFSSPQQQHSQAFSQQQPQGRAQSQPQQQQQQQQQPSQVSRGITNSDLLADADPEISGKLSQATSDIANVSNQIKSLAGQTSGLQEKKIRAEQELSKILNTKKEIEGKLKQLRSSYENEAKQVDQVEANLVSAKEETEALRSESSISEAKFNHLSTQLNEKQIAMEDLQKQNSAFKEKLGYLNAEIVELEKQLTQLTAENQRLSNQLSVKKSQAQVSIVKNEELKSKILEIEESNRKIAEEYRKAEEEARKAEEEYQLGLQRQLEAERNKPTPPLPTLPPKPVSKDVHPKAEAPAAPLPEQEHSSVSDPSHAISAGAATAAAAVGTAIVGAAATLGLTESKEEPTHEQPAHEEPLSTHQEPEVKDLVVPAEPVEREPETATKELSSSEFTGHDVVQPDEQVQLPTESSPAPAISEPTSFHHPDSVTATSTASTSEYQDNETPVTSPNNSEFQFPQGNNAGIVGGMVGMPGVLVGVQRTDSLTSSVQNNAALSVRDDNIEGISDRETLEEDDHVPDVSETIKSASANKDEENKVAPTTSNREDSSDGDKLSSGVESFEIVNAEDAAGSGSASHELPSYSQSVPEQAHAVSKDVQEDHQIGSTSSPRVIDQEFPPIKELDYDESSSDDESPDDNFDDAVDKFPVAAAPAAAPVSVPVSVPAPLPVDEPKKTESHPEPTINFDSAFDDLEPASPEKPELETKNDLFGDEFDGLQEAVPEDEYDEFAMDNSFDFNENFTNHATDSNFPDFGASEPTNDNNASTATDEWEQLFAGFGNAGLENNDLAAPVQPVAEHHTSSTITPTHQATHGEVNGAPEGYHELVDELTGMGFDEKTALEALEKENWDLQNATNFLLDHA